ncbi:hypothetical protein Afil01_66000 [Actinorhabdospora filicis]|uniref:Type VII secretion protein EccB n=2 Tax=Actinorhabdospora filicis TaxID=1785913 RepID=A0A9W6STI8_9ACTN|nr:hypothetical protein Afil01_66000 [Actinorhabdospora filicis]
MLSANPETLDLPMRRMALSLVGGFLAAVLACVGFWVVGKLYPGGATAWQAQGTIVIEEETGAVYVYRDSALLPMANFASARLYVGIEAPVVTTVHQSSLEGTPRQGMYGIPDAPKALPDPKLFVSQPWQMCSTSDPAAPTRHVMRAVVGQRPATGLDLAGRAMLVADDAGEYYLLWNDRLWLLPKASAATTMKALGVPQDRPVAISQFLVPLFSRGPDLAVEATGDAVVVADQTLQPGTVIRSGELYYLVTGGHLERVGVLAATIAFHGDPATVRSVPQNQILDSMIQTPAPSQKEALPDAPPQVHVPEQDTRDTAVCAVSTGAAGPNGTPSHAEVYTPTPPVLTAANTRLTVAITGRVSYLDLPAGRSALVRATVSPGAGGGTVYLVTEGRKFGIADAASLTALGYGKSTVDEVPAQFLGLIPDGAALSSQTARTAVP